MEAVDGMVTSASGLTVISDATTSPLASPEPCPTEPEVTYSREFLIGVLLAISSSAFIGTSFIVKKKGLLRFDNSSETRELYH
ncbi:hypothetical protein GBAR_LOCUS23125 [Geodia barretti]|uniref:Uncharacterized protein n=1 Tax=Geodia barretti TaxID=519541 RepID=A0AA35X2F5_GEOBA|nr:hypothetical protein GBAR_LOCUS23125 [Geodia barretti]